MSYTIEYKRKVFKETEPGDWEPTFWAFVEQGDNNVYEAGSRRRRARDWELIARGWSYSVIGKICQRAGATEGGSLQYPGGHHTTPEEYIKSWRAALVKAKPFSEILTHLPIYKATIFLKAGAPKSEYDRSCIEEIKAACTFDGMWREQEAVYVKTIETPEDLKTWRNLAYRDNVVSMRSLWVRE